MEQEMMMALAKVGGYAAVGLAAMGSSMGTGIAGAAAIGAWKKCYQQDKPAPFLLLAMAGAPLSQTIYGMIMMILISGARRQDAGYVAALSRGRCVRRPGPDVLGPVPGQGGCGRLQLVRRNQSGICKRPDDPRCCRDLRDFRARVLDHGDGVNRFQERKRHPSGTHPEGVFL